LNLLVNAKEYDFEAKKIVGKLRNVQRLEKKENRLKNKCEILSKQVKEYEEIVPLAQKIVAMNIDISELLALDTALNQTARQYNVPLSTEAFRVLSDIIDYNKIGGLRKELEKLLTQIFAVKECCFRQNESMMALLSLRTHGITQEQIISLNNFLESTINVKSSS
jgi:hypothetical protein